MNILKPYLEPVIRRQQTGSKWRMMVFWWSAIALAAGLALILAKSGEPMPDYLVSWLAGILFAGTFMVLFINTVRGKVDYQKLAREIESKHPELHATLLTAVEQAPDPKTRRFNFLQKRVINEAIAACEKTMFAKAAPRRDLALLQFGNAGMLFFICVCLYQLHKANPEPFSEVRAEQPERAQALLAAELKKVEPGNAEIERGTPLAVLAHFTGKSPGNTTLVITSLDSPERRIELVKNLDDPIFGATLSSVDGSFTYHVEYDQQKSETFRISVYEHPALDRADATLDYPSYTKLPKRTVEDTRRLSAVEGTQLSYKFHLNKPAQTARLVGVNDEVVELRVHAKRPLAELPPLTLTQNRTWKLELTDDANRANKIAPRIEVVVYANKPPKIRISSPHGDQQISPLEEVDFAAEIEDDFGLGAFGLTYNVNGGDLSDVTLGKSTPGNTKILASHLLAVEMLAVEPDQLINWYFWAEDIGPDGNKRRAYSDMFFAEIRPFEEIFRQGQDQSSQQQQQQQQQSPNQQTEQLIKLQKQIINATWRLRRQPATLAADAPVLLQSQKEALGKAKVLLEKSTDEKTSNFIKAIIQHMETSVNKLTEAQGQPKAINKPEKDTP
jgi:hypothetical protein